MQEANSCEEHPTNARFQMGGHTFEFIQIDLPVM